MRISGELRRKCSRTKCAQGSFDTSQVKNCAFQRNAQSNIISFPPRRPTAGLIVDQHRKCLVTSLDGGVLPIQGPPGAGKAYTGARMICELMREGKRVGVTAVSHKVIRKLLDEIVGAASEEGLSLRCV